MTNIHKSKLWKHVAALIYDIFPILGIFLVTSLIFVLLRTGKEVEPETLWFQLLLFFEVYLYFTYSWKKGGQTIGMKAWKIGILNHHKLTWQAVTLRFITGIFSTLLLGAGLWLRISNSKNLTWMDMACGQPVIDLTKSTDDSSPEPASKPQN
ncbi:RDD family protein [Marinicella litoralis]|uniref:Putative RDD family membrane protein YckC n=1 Tax=Marinicella litoralis TaxID=644220 RepID=A0A4R6XS62_9GAMM|nr:RDD family protein [Marinicella litoralis]TDR20787.1 putative RDD family membrane protein YckC [Marinicella litoralis]